MKMIKEESQNGVLDDEDFITIEDDDDFSFEVD